MTRTAELHDVAKKLRDHAVRMAIHRRRRMWAGVSK